MIIPRTLPGIAGVFSSATEMKIHYLSGSANNTDRHFHGQQKPWRKAAKSPGSQSFLFMFKASDAQML